MTRVRVPHSLKVARPASKMTDLSERASLCLEHLSDYHNAQASKRKENCTSASNIATSPPMRCDAMSSPAMCPF